MSQPNSTEDSPTETVEVPVLALQTLLTMAACHSAEALGVMPKRIGEESLEMRICMAEVLMEIAMDMVPKWVVNNELVLTKVLTLVAEGLHATSQNQTDTTTVRTTVVNLPRN